jgi:predicted ATPase
MSLFVMTGAMGSGKSAILSELAGMGYGVVTEPAREVLAEQRAAGGDGLPEKSPTLFCELMLSSAVASYERMRDSTAPVVFDRGVPDQVGYAELFGIDASAAEQAAGVCRYHDEVFVLPSWPEIYRTDDERTMSFEAAAAFGDRVRAIYARLGYTLVDVPRGSPSERARFIADKVQERMR